jgi:hypothetical protein
VLRNERNSTCDNQQKETQIGYQKTNRTPYLVAITTIRPLLLILKKSTFSLKIHSLHITHHLLHIRSFSATKNPLYTTWKTNPSQLDPIRQLTDATYLHMINNTKTSSSEAEALNSTGEVDPLYIL